MADSPAPSPLYRAALAVQLVGLSELSECCHDLGEGGLVMSDNSSLVIELGPDALDALAEFEAAENRLQQLVSATQFTSQELDQARVELSSLALVVTLGVKACAALAGRPHRL